MRLQIEIGAIRDPHQFVPLPLLIIALGKKSILNVHRALGVMCQFFLWLFVKTQVFSRDSYILKPLITSVDPLLMGGFVVTRAHKIFHLHLLKLASPEDEVTRRNFVAKRFADLGHAKWKLAAAGVQHVEKIYENSLRGFRTQIDERFGIVFSRGAVVSIHSMRSTLE